MKSSIAVAVLMLITSSVMGQVLRDEGGVTFPVMADFTDADGTHYWSRIRVYADTKSRVYLRYEFTTVDGKSYVYPDVLNPMLEGSDGTSLAYLYLWRRDIPPSAGSLRIVPIDQTGKLMEGVHLTGEGHLYVDNVNGSMMAERVDGIPDSRLFFMGRDRFLLVDTPTLRRNQTRMIFFTNFSSQAHTYKATLAIPSFDGPGAVKWDWSDTITLQPNTTGVLTVPAIPQAVFDANLFGQKIYRSVYGVTGCVDCQTQVGVDPNAYYATYVEIDQMTHDIRVSDDAMH